MAWGVSRMMPSVRCVYVPGGGCVEFRSVCVCFRRVSASAFTISGSVFMSCKQGAAAARAGGGRGCFGAVCGGEFCFL